MLPVAGIAAVVALVGAPVLASADSPSAGVATTAAPPSAVESFAYPNADQALRDKGIKLIKGDGHITFVACDDSADQISVMTVKGEDANPQEFYCFKATAKSGYLALELPRVFAIETDNHPVSAGIRPQDDPSASAQTVTVAKNGYKSVGEGNVGGSPSVLMELRVTG